MRVKVLRNFRDKYTKALHKKDSILEVDKGRFEEINSTPFGILVEEINTDYESMTKKELIEYAKQKGIELDMKMTKSEMIKELT